MLQHSKIFYEMNVQYSITYQLRKCIHANKKMQILVFKNYPKRHINPNCTLYKEKSVFMLHSSRSDYDFFKIILAYNFYIWKNDYT